MSIILIGHEEILLAKLHILFRYLSVLDSGRA